MKWQPINTAPKDGTHIIGFFPEVKGTPRYAESVYWNGAKWSWSQDSDTPIHQPTRWIAMPDESEQ